MNNENCVSYSQIKEVRNQALKTAGHARGYVFTQNINDYVRGLPPYSEEHRELSFLDLIDSAIAERGVARLLDIGCGNGGVISKLTRKYTGRLDAYGVKVPSNIPEKNYEQEILENTDTVTILEGDGQRLSHVEELPIGDFDIALAYSSFYHMSDGMAALKEIYKALRDGGYGFIGPLCADQYFQPLTEFSKLIRTLNNDEYSFQIHRISYHEMLDPEQVLSFKKTKPRLHLPIRYAGFMEITQDRSSCLYKLEE